MLRKNVMFMSRILLFEINTTKMVHIGKAFESAFMDQT